MFLRKGKKAMKRFWLKCIGLSVLCLSNGFSEPLISPLPSAVKVDTQKVGLGKKLFTDPELSKDGTVACINCHNLYSGGADSAPVSTGVGGKNGNINSPTVFNASYNLAQFWNGRAKNLKDQVPGPMTNPVEMANSPQKIVAKISSNPYYVKLFKLSYPIEGITMETIADAIAEFEKTLITPNSRFDQYLKGDIKALNKLEKEGFELFKNRGCIACHNGINVGGNMYQKFGVFAQYRDRFNSTGRYEVTKNPQDKYYFKVPSLRNVEKTAPYFHDGSVKTLEEAVQTMAYYQLGRKLSTDEIVKIAAFLRTLSGDLPKSVTAK